MDRFGMPEYNLESTEQLQITEQSLETGNYKESHILKVQGNRLKMQKEDIKWISATICLLGVRACNLSSF